MSYYANEWITMQSRIARLAIERGLWELAPDNDVCPVNPQQPILAKMEAGDYVGPVMAGSFDWDGPAGDGVVEYVLVENTGKEDLLEKFIPVRKTNQ